MAGKTSKTAMTPARLKAGRMTRKSETEAKPKALEDRDSTATALKSLSHETTLTL